MRNDLTAERLRELFHYDPETGFFFRLKAVSCARSGLVDTVLKRGYLTISVDAVKYVAHRLAWLYVTGRWPEQQIDHIDGCKTNNRFANLRDVSISINAQNRRRPIGGNAMLGAHKTGARWTSSITVNNKNIRIGMFDSPEKAHQAYVAAKRKLHPGCTI